MQSSDTSSSSSNTQPAASGDVPPWMQSSPSDSPFGEPAASSDLPPWAAGSAPSENLDAGIPDRSSFGVTGALPWRQEADLGGSGGQADSFSFSDELNDNDADFDPFADLGSAATPASSSSDDLSWLNDATQNAPEPPAQQTPPAPQIKKLSSLPSLQQNEPQQTQQPPAPGGIKKLPTMQQPSQSEEPRPQIKKLSSAQPPAQPPQQSQPPQRDISEMTYEEWERSQAEEAAEAARTDEDRLLDEVPDWFKSDAPPPPAPTPSKGKAQSGPKGGEFMPEWFVGQEEQHPSDTPDWFKNVDLSATPLVGTSNNPVEPEPSFMDSSPAEDIPDWFNQPSSAVPGMDEIDFNAMFVADTPAETGSKLSAKLPGLTSQQPEPQQPELSNVQSLELPQIDLQQNEAPVEELPALESEPTFEMPQGDLRFDDEPVVEAEGVTSESGDLDWMSEMPELDDLLVTPSEQESQSQQSQPVPQANAAPADDLSGLLDALDMPESQPQQQSDSLDWLMEEQPSIGNTAPVQSLSSLEQSAEPAGDMPDWMRDMASNPSTSPSTASAEPIESGEMPDWMQEMASKPETAPDAPAEIVSGDIPDWMQGMASVAPAAPEPAAPMAGDDWMSDFAADLGDLSTATTSAETPAQSDDDWLSSMSNVAAPAEPVQATSSAPSSTSGSTDVDIDALLKMTGPLVPLPEPTTSSATSDEDDLLTFNLDEVLGPAIEDPFAQPARAQRQSAEQTSEPDFNLDLDEGIPAIPDIYEPGVEDLASIFSETEPEAEPASDEAPLEPALPEWVTDLKPSEGPVIINIVDQEVRFTDKPLVQVPEQLRALRERSKRVSEKRKAEAPAKSETPTAAPLAGISDTIDIVPESIQPRIVIGDSSPLIISDLDARRIRVIQNILGAEEKMLRERALAEDEREAQQAAAVSPKAVNRSKPKIDRYIITLLLALA